MIVTDRLATLKLNESIFEVEPIAIADFQKELNEVIFDIYGMRFHILNENRKFQMFAPEENDSNPICFNIVVSELKRHTKKRSIWDAGRCNLLRKC